MTYRITGLDPAALDRAALLAAGAIRVTADARPGFPCRATLEDAEPGETLLLFQHVSHDVATPFRAAYAIYVRDRAEEPATFVDAVPPVFAGRTLSLRGFDDAGMLRRAALAAPGEADAGIRAMLAHDEVAYIDAHNAAPGCFAARIVRDDAERTT